MCFGALAETSDDACLLALVMAMRFCKPQANADWLAEVGDKTRLPAALLADAPVVWLG